MKNLKTIYVTKAKNHFKEIIQPPATKLKVPTSLEKNFSYGDLQECIGIYFLFKCFEFVGIWESVNINQSI